MALTRMLLNRPILLLLQLVCVCVCVGVCAQSAQPKSNGKERVRGLHLKKDNCQRDIVTGAKLIASQLYMSTAVANSLR